jgi:hypothetical protein
MGGSGRLAAEYDRLELGYGNRAWRRRRVVLERLVVERQLLRGSVIVFRLLWLELHELGQ